MRLSENFTLEEFERSQVAKRLDLDNSIPKDLQPSIKALVENILQPLRTAFNKPVIISSGYRNPYVNGIVGGSKDSQHCKGEAADFTIKGVDNQEVASWIKENTDFDQLILEFYSESSPNGGWIHCSYTRPNRNEILTAIKDHGQTVYRIGFPEYDGTEIS